MAATELQKFQALHTRSQSQANAGIALANDIESLIDHELSAEKMREELAKFLAVYQARRNEANDQYKQQGIALGELDA